MGQRSRKRRGRENRHTREAEQAAAAGAFVIESAKRAVAGLPVACPDCGHAAPPGQVDVTHRPGCMVGEPIPGIRPPHHQEG